MAWGWTATNPVQLATPPSVPRVGRQIATPEIVSQLLEEARLSRNPENLVAFRLLAATGARRGEICGLRWTSVDFGNSRIEIRAAMGQLASGEVREKDPKTHQIR
ncbi:MAG: tyrosine-type recombinase/integrase [Actinomycetia bacterium]|nr:tyrosine-type recombinase/integrase [Actinomycetes bacterium]